MATSKWFTRFAKQTSKLAGRPIAFILAVVILIVWAASGPLFGFGDTWQLVINTGTTIITFLMVFVIQNTQNRDTAALQIKLDEVIRSIEGAHNKLLDLEELDEKELEQIRENYERLAKEARDKMESGGRDTDSPEVDGGNRAD